MSELALQLIAENKQTRSTYLDFGNCGLTVIPDEIGDCVWLETLILSSEWIEFNYTNEVFDNHKSQNKGGANSISELPAAISKLEGLKVLIMGGEDYSNRWPLSDLSPLSSLTVLASLSCSSTHVKDLSPIANLNNLISLMCSYTPVQDLSPIANLNNLISLDCSRTQVQDWSSIANLNNLTSLNCSYTLQNLSSVASLTALTSLFCEGWHIQNLSPIAKMSNLKSLSLYATQVKDLSPIANLNNLTSLNCSGTQVQDLSPIANLTALTSLDCSSTQVQDLSPIANLNNLTSLDCKYTQVQDLSPIANLSNLTSLYCNNTQVQDLSPIANLSNLTSLYCNNTQVQDLSPIANLTDLTSINCSWTKVRNLSPIANLTALTSLNCSWMQLQDLSPLSNLTALISLDCSWLQLQDLSPLSNLTALISLECSSTQVQDLSPISNLNNLTSLDCSYTQVQDLSPIANLNNLTSLDCSDTQVQDLSPISNLASLTSLKYYSTQVQDLSPISNLTALTSLDCSDTQVQDLSPISNLIALTSLNCSGTQVQDLSPISNLNNLTSLKYYSTQVQDLSPISNLTALTSISCSSSQVQDLSPIANLIALTSLNCSGTQVQDLSPIANLTALISLDCSNTQVQDLSPITNLTALTSLDCSDTQVQDLSPISNLIALTSLNCSGTQVQDLSPISNLNNLTSLKYYSTQVQDLSPISNLTALTSISCSSSQVQDLSPIANLIALTSLNCSGTQVQDLSPIANLTALISLDCSNTQVQDLSPITNLAALTSLDCSNTQVQDLSLIANLTAMTSLYCKGCPIKGIPPEIAFSGDVYSIRKYILSNPSAPFNEVKLILAGNTQAGKSNIAEYLLKGDGFLFDEVHDSSHGILIGTWMIRHDGQHLPLPEIIETLTVNMWDFGGQDFYHGTHGMFFLNGAVYLLVWEHGMEEARTTDTGGEKAYFMPADYWLEDIRHFAEDSQILSVQNKTDRDGKYSLSPDWTKQYRVADEYNISIKAAASIPRNPDAYEDWNDFVRKLVIRLSELPALEQSTINPVWLEIRGFIRELQQDVPRSPNNPFAMVSEAQPYLTKPEFVACCEAYSPTFAQYVDTFLLLFDKRGVLIHFSKHPTLQNFVFLNPDWVTKKIYDLLSKDLRKRGDKSGLFDTAYAKAKLGKDADLLLQLMLEFEVIYRDPWNNETYIAVQYLPKFNPEAHHIDSRYELSDKRALSFRMSLFHQQRILRQITVRLGSDKQYKFHLLRQDCIALVTTDDALIRIVGERVGNVGEIKIFTDSPDKWGLQMALEVLLCYFDKADFLGIPIPKRDKMWAEDAIEYMNRDENLQKIRSFFDTESDFSTFMQAVNAKSMYYVSILLSPNVLPKITQVARIWASFFSANLQRAQQRWKTEAESDEDKSNRKSTERSRFEHLCKSLHISGEQDSWVAFSALLQDPWAKQLIDNRLKIIDKEPFKPLLQSLGYNMKETTAKKVFISYSHKDETWKDELLVHCANMIRLGLMDVWQDRKIMPGDEWDKEIMDALDASDLVIFMVSPNFMASRYIWEKELPTAIMKRSNGKSKVVPIHVKPVEDKDSPFSNLQGLPRDKKPLSQFEDADDGLYKVAVELRRLLENWD